MTNNRGIHKVFALLILTVAGVFALTWSPNPPVSVPTSTKKQDTLTPRTSNNYIVSNANAIGKQRNALTGAVPPTYPSITAGKPLSQTVNGYTVLLNPVYANVNRVVLTYTVQNLENDVRAKPPFPFVDIDGKRLRDFPRARLSDAQGNTLPQLYPSGELVESLGGSVLAFDTTALSELPQTLYLHLILDVAQMRKSAATYMGVEGPFTFDFSLSVDHVHRVAEVHQVAATYDGGTIALEKVVVTRREARIFWGRYHARKSLAPWVSSVRLEIGKGSGTPSPLPGIEVGPNGFVDASLIDKHGEWAVSIWHFYTGGASHPSQVGPIFRFTVPPLGAPPQPTPTPGLPTPLPLPTSIQSDRGYYSVPFPRTKPSGASTQETPTLTPVPPSPTPTPTLQPALRPVFPANLISLRQTTKGYTIALYPIAADANRIVLHYTVTGPQGQALHAFGVRRNGDYSVTGPQLVDKSGRELSLIDVGYPRVASGSPPSDAIEAIFDVNSREPLPSQLNLRLVIDLSVSNPPSDISYWPPTGATPSIVSPRPFILPPHPRGSPTPTPIQELFTFDFSMPVNLARRVAEVNQTQKAEGWEMTLDRVIVTPSETHIIMRIPESRTPILRCRQLLGTLQIGSWSRSLTDLSGGVESWPSAGNCSYRYPQTSLMDKQGDWILTVDKWVSTFRDMSTWSSGPWVFHFNVPPAISNTQPEN